MKSAPWPKLMTIGLSFCVGIVAFAGLMIGCSAEPKTSSVSEGTQAAMKEFRKDGKLFCPLMKTEIASVDEAEGFVDYEGTRYYVCCGFCLKKAQADPAAVAKAAAAL